MIASTGMTTNPDMPESITTYLTGAGPRIQPPASLDIDNVKWELVSALELDMVESDVSGPTPELDPDLGLSPPTEKVLLRTITAKDLTFGSGRSVRYAEVGPFPHSSLPGPGEPKLTTM